MSDIEEGEIESSPPHSGSNTPMSGEGKLTTGMGVFADSHIRQNKPIGQYRSTAHTMNSSSESESEGEEDTPLWQQKKEKYFRKTKEIGATHCPSPTLPEYNASNSATASKKRNNVWGSILLEQDLTQALVHEANVKKSTDLNSERSVESYDFTNKYRDTRPDLDEVEDESKESNSMMDDHTSYRSSQLRGREIVGYNDALLDNDRKSRKRKRKANFDDNDDKKSVHSRLGNRLGERLGNKRVTTVTVGDIEVNEDMDIKALAKIIADTIHEPKIELIERIAEHMGKAVAIKILNQTRDVEEGGGMLTHDGSRRRTPGGVYLQLLKQQPEYSKDMYKLIFVEDNEWKMQQKKHKQRNRAKKRAQQQKSENRDSKSRSRSNSTDRPQNRNSAEQMDDGENTVNKQLESSEKMDCADKGGKIQLNRKARSHSQSEDNVKAVDTQKEMSKLKSSRSKSFSYSDDDTESEEDTAPKKKPGEFDFQAELEAAKKLISKRKSEAESGKDTEMTEEAGDTIDDMNDDLKDAEANVVDIPLDG